jgi:hypothetical protein
MSSDALARCPPFLGSLNSQGRAELEAFGDRIHNGVRPVCHVAGVALRLVSCFTPPHLQFVPHLIAPCCIRP